MSDVPDDTTAQPAEGQGSDTSQTAPLAQPVGQGGGPWASDLESRFSDPAVREAVDGFLRETVQPYVTQLEQTRPAEAVQLWEQLNENPGETFLGITEELFGAEAAESVRDALLGQFGEGDEPAGDDPAAAGVDIAAGADQKLDPRVERAVSFVEQQENQRLWDSGIAGLRQKAAAEGEGVQVHEELIAPFVAAAGDFDTAYAGYKKWYSQFRQQFGEAPAPEPAPGEDSTPPPVLGSDTTATSTPPTEKKYSTFDDALDDFFDNDMKKSAPTPVGST